MKFYGVVRVAGRLVGLVISYGVVRVAGLYGVTLWGGRDSMGW